MEKSRYVYVKYHPGDEYNNEILSGRVRPGMNRNQVRASWGDPHDIGPGPDTRVDEEWMYRDAEPSRGNQIYILSFDRDLLAKVEVVRNPPTAPTNAAQASRQEELNEPDDGGKNTP